mmetsp:Transcript_6779/g.8546  ORF Transcript_6779/g.8546 Transcript_6779/m.8546 type:complete len:292 (-) Transcript_6779:448-1323(-)|eukprot:CAMPEP_0204824440 /NCGR_PEP_ID=MMETSP1346-20131115/2468_1 /ASSEMBLY_ACC=CAM_ASM_000771 /TAXON_ID=215587 /ORGANISM="Aplanochytrium stocchinoi, Strain GSBS06" /LENGTH=291 /DNA_ID=CAMNT_0051951603 /DNA_START=716 /DNA_END=1591 /DNA_ORIENTATION=+
MNETLKPLLSGSFAGACSTVAGAPFDTVKVRLQTHSHRFNGFAHCFMGTIRDESVASLYKGVTPAMTAAVLENSVVFFANSCIKRMWTYAKNNYYYEYEYASNDFSLSELAVIGGLAGVFSATAICPAETIKCRSQAHLSIPGSAKLSPIKIAHDLVKTDGIRGLFQGLPAQYARDIPFNFVFFGSYETACRGLCALHGYNSKNHLGTLDLLTAGGLAGVAGWTFTIPMDTVKSRAQISGRCSRKVMYDIFRESGIKGFFQGWSAAVLRAFPANGALFAAYEISERCLGRE